MNKQRKAWTRDETVLALGLYLQLPYGKLDHHTKEVVELAKAMNRTPSALSMKMCNIGRLDPTLQNRGVSGLKNGAKLEQTIWDEFNGRREELIAEYYVLRKALVGETEKTDDALIKTPQGLEGVRLQKYRINQSFFRREILASYDECCCISGISDSRLLIASHIKPWAKCDNGNEKTDARNGLCLSPLYDRVFDIGLITLDESYKVVLSKSLKDALTGNVYSDHFARYEHCMIKLPVRCVPSQEYLAYHREHIFQK